MTDRPILFSAPMILAHRENRKTQTRRTLKPQPGDLDKPFMMDDGSWHVTDSRGGHMSPLDVRYRVGDRLWARETISFEHCWTGTKPSDVPKGEPVWYWADGNPTEGDWTKPIVSIHMPRWCSRITDTVTDVRVERLQDISEADAIMEGCSAVVGSNWWQGYRGLGYGGALLHQMTPGDAPPEWMIEPKPAGRSAWADKSARDGFRDIWNTINGAGSWDANPWVIALTFTVTHRNIDSAPMPEREEPQP